MASDDISLLFRLKADADQLKREVTGARTHVAKEVGGITSEGGKLAQIAGPAAIAAGAIATIAAGAFTAGKAIFDLAGRTSKAGSEIFDASKKVSVSAETLSTLKFNAEQAGSSLPEVTQALIQMERRLVDAAGGNDQLSAAFRTLGVNVRDGLTNPEAALSQLVKRFNELPDGAEKTALAMQVFGRSGANLLPMLEALGGDLEAAKKRAAELGVVFDEDAARAADEFGDALDTLKAQAEGLAFTFGSDVMPVITRAMQNLTESIRENRTELVLWRNDAKAAASAAASMAVEYPRATGLIAHALTTVLNPALMQSIMLLRAFVYLRNQMRTVGEIIGATIPKTEQQDITGGRGVARGIGDGMGGGGRGGRGARDEAMRAVRTEAEQAQAEELLRLQEQTNLLNAQRDRQVTDTQAYYDELIALENKKVDALVDRWNAELLALQTTHRNMEEYEKRSAESRIEIKKARVAAEDKIKKYETDRDEKIAQLELDAERRRIKMAEEADDRNIQRIERQVEEGILFESDGIEKIEAIRLEAHDRHVAYLKMEETSVATSAERLLAIYDELILMEGRRAFAVEEGARRVAAARAGEQQARVAQSIPGVMGPQDVEDQFQSAIDKLGAPPIAPWEQWGAVIQDVKGMALDAFGAMGQALGSMVQQWVLYGNVGPNAVRKMTAAVLAALAAEAAAKMVFQLAEGFAKLAGFMPGPAALHFKAAAFYGAVALSSAAAGRAIAGNAFQDQGAGGAQGGGGGGRTQTSTAPPPIDVSRRLGEPVQVKITVTRDVGSIVNAVVEDYRGNGRTRQVFVQDGVMATP